MILSIIIPCFNEKNTIKEIIFAVKNAVNNFTTVAAPVKTETLMSSDERIFLKNLFKKAMM